MDDDDLWLDYRATRDRLLGISLNTKGKVLSKPMVKVVEDGLVVGILTETNQFVQVSPPSEHLDEDGMTTIEHSSFAMKDGTNADKVLTTVKTGDEIRLNTVRKIRLETDFYNVFRSIVRVLLNQFENRSIRNTILDAIRNVGVIYHHKLRTIEAQVRELVKDAVVFQEMDDATLKEIGEVVMCQQANGECTTTGAKQKYCLSTEDGSCRTVLPKRHLITGKENERIYLGRMADELLRYRRIQLFMFHTKHYLNISNSEYQINEDELLLLESLLNHDYFRGLSAYNVNEHVQNIVFDTADPEISQVYSNEITLAEQANLKQRASGKATVSEYILDCIQETKPRVIGNDKAGSWRPLFPVSTKEIVFGQSILCSYIPVIYMLQEMHKNTNISVQNVKMALWKGYQPWIEVYGSKIISILQKQGKRDLLEMVKKGRATLEHVIFSDGYYLTDLDWWIMARSADIPIILFSSTSLKLLFGTTNWLRLSGAPKSSNEKYFFVRSPAEVKRNQPSSYHILSERFSFSELKGNGGAMFLQAERGDPAYSEHTQGLEHFLSKYHLVSRGAV
jgi:hypothetical protein